MSGMNDPKNIVGLSSLMVDKEFSPSFDIDQLEKEVIKGGLNFEEDENNILDNFNKDIERLSRGDLFAADINPPKMETADDDEEVDLFASNSNFNNSYNTEGTGSNIGSGGAYGNNGGYNGGYRDESRRDTRQWDARHPHDKQLNYMTIEEEKQSHINNVLHGMNSEEMNFSIEKEQDEEDRNKLIEQIDMLRETLIGESIDISNIPEVSRSMPTSEILNIYKILTRKNDRSRYCSLAEEVILTGAYGMEYLFDGEKDWFGRTPDLVGWSNTVKVKLRRMRYETSTFVQEIMQDYSISPGLRLCIELIPSMFLYSRKKKQSTAPKIRDQDYADAISDFNNM